MSTGAREFPGTRGAVTDPYTQRKVLRAFGSRVGWMPPFVLWTVTFFKVLGTLKFKLVAPGNHILEQNIWYVLRPGSCKAQQTSSYSDKWGVSSLRGSHVPFFFGTFWSSGFMVELSPRLRNKGIIGSLWIIKWSPLSLWSRGVYRHKDRGLSLAKW